jgi:hypothetical protein
LEKVNTNDGTNGQKNSKKAKQILRAISPILIALVVSIIIGVLLHMDLTIPILQEEKSILSFNGRIVSTNENVALLINNNDNKAEKSIIINGLKPEPIIEFTDFRNIIGKNLAITLGEVKFSEENAQTDLDVNVPRIIPRGSYEGALTINDRSSTAMTVTSEPKISEALAWVLVGILLSIIVWEFIIVYGGIAPNYNIYTNSHRWINKKIFGEMRPTGKTVVIDIGTVIFGIALGFLTVLNQSYITTIIVIHPLDIAVLIGIGIGVGSLREFAAKLAQR